MNENVWYIRINALLEEGIASERVIGTVCTGGISFYWAVDRMLSLSIEKCGY